MDDLHFMEMCLREAEKAFIEEEVPVGAIIVSPQKKVIARAHNLTIRSNRPTSHAEMLAINMAADMLDNYRLIDCTLYVSMEPCIMCAGAMIEARVRRVVFGCYDEKRGALGSVTDVNALPLNHRLEVQGGVLQEKCQAILQRFFKARREGEVPKRS